MHAVTLAEALRARKRERRPVATLRFTSGAPAPSKSSRRYALAARGAARVSAPPGTRRARAFRRGPRLGGWIFQGLAVRDASALTELLAKREIQGLVVATNAIDDSDMASLAARCAEAAIPLRRFVTRWGDVAPAHFEKGTAA